MKQRRGFRVLLPLFVLCAATPAHLYAQESEEDTSAPVEVVVLTPEQNRIEMEIKTSTISELAAWCRSLGLSEGGTAADLARRLREHFKLTQQGDLGQPDTRKIITIESARSTEYFTIEVVDEEYARLTGEVRLSLKDSDAIHRIKAWSILFNRTRNILTASGGVEYIKEEGEKIESFHGESITVDLDNWSSIFLGGVLERSLQGDSSSSDQTTYVFSGTVISRDDEEVTTLNRATIHSTGEESLWSISASRVWLLPGSDFAILNAVLKVGEIPVLYLPFFYYPADEVVFHPVIGFRTREGSFVQMTMYILGRPKATSSTQVSSITKILGSSEDMEKTREGLFLRSTGKKARDPSATSLTAMLDFYANLGTYIGMDLELPSKGILGALNLSAGIGLTRTIATVGNTYTPFFPNYDGEIDWNYSNLFSMEVPFRYRFKTASSISGTYGSFSWDIPFYSDPLVDSDFVTTRSTEMDWLNIVQQGAATEAEITSQTYQGAYSWNFNVSVSPRFPNMSPYITGISIGNISTNISFTTIDRRSTYGANNIKYYSPSSFFYAPTTATLYSLSGSVAGNPLSLGGGASSQSAVTGETKELPDSIKNIGIPRSPFEETEKEEAPKRDPADALVPPVLSQRFEAPRSGSTRLSMNYSITPSSASTLKFDSGKWRENSDIDWGDISSVVTTLSGNASASVSIAHTENLFANNFTYNFTGNWRQYSYLNEEAQEFLTAGSSDPAKVAEAKRREYSQSNFTTNYNNSASIRPLYRNATFGSSSIQYNLGGLAVRSNFIGTGDDPDWEMIYGEWNKEKINTHNFAGNLAATIMEKSQSLSITADLPPRDSALAFNTSLNIWLTQTTASWRILFPGEDDRRRLEPFNATVRVNFTPYGSFSQNLTLDTEDRELTSLNSSLGLSQWGVTISYAASRMLGYEFILDSSGTSGSWVQRTGDENLALRSRDINVNFSKSFSVTELWENRIRFSITPASTLYLDLQRYTNSYLNFSLGFTLGLNNFLDLSLSANSNNSMIYRYFKDMPMFADEPVNALLPDGSQNNFFLDLINSFRFDNDELRRLSGFKMKGFTVTAKHYLGDWNATLNWEVAPYRPTTGARQIELNNKVSFLLQWVPISEAKSEVTYNKSEKPEWIVK